MGQLTGSTHGTGLRLTGLADKPCFENLFRGVLAGAGCVGRDLRLAVRRDKEKLDLALGRGTAARRGKEAGTTRCRHERLRHYNAPNFQLALRVALS